MSFKAHLETLASIGLTPYVASSRAGLNALDLSVLGRTARIHLLEREEDRPFHQAFLAGNALGFNEPGVGMPGWVLVDCVLLQTAIIGFAIARKRAAPDLIEAFAADPRVNLDELEHLPVSGQIAGLALDGTTLVGFSLWSLRRYLPAVPALGVITKALALLAYRAQGRRFIGITHYDHKSLSMHGKFGRPMWIEAPKVPMHPGPEKSLVYGMTIDFDPDELHGRQPPGRYDFLMRADDDAKKDEIANGIADGRRYVIAPPFQIETNGVIQLPIRVENAP